MSFQMSIDTQESQLVMKPKGELDIYNTPNFKDQAVLAYDRNSKDILIDGENLEYVDSTGLGGFIYLLNYVQEKGNVVGMKNIKPNIRKLFTITKLDEVFRFEEEENEQR